MTFDPTKPCRTRSGLEVELLPRRLQNSSQPLIGVIKNTSGYEYCFQWSENGSVMICGQEHELDLENIPAASRLWANLYHDPVVELPSVAIGALQPAQVLNSLRLASLEFIFDGQTLTSVKIHHNFERVLRDKIPF